MNIRNIGNIRNIVNIGKYTKIYENTQRELFFLQFGGLGVVLETLGCPGASKVAGLKKVQNKLFVGPS